MSMLANIIHRNGRNGLGERESEANLSVFRREIDDALARVFRALDVSPWRMMDESFAADWPALDISEDEKSITIRVDVPGLRSEDVKVETVGQDLIIRGERESEKDIGHGKHRRKERFFGSFERSIYLPAYAQADKATAKCEKGVLVVSVPLATGEARKQVPVASVA